MTPDLKSGGKKKRDILHSHEHSHEEPLKQVHGGSCVHEDYGSQIRGIMP